MQQVKKIFCLQLRDDDLKKKSNQIFDLKNVPKAAEAEV